MFIIIYGFLLVISLIVGKSLFKSLLNPITIWSSWWSFVGIMANLAFFDYYKPSTFVNTVIIVGIIVYFVCCVIYGIINKRRWSNETKTDYLDEYFRYDLFFLINFIAISIEIPFFFRAISTLSKHGFQLVFLRGVLTDVEEGIVSGGLISIIRDSGIRNVFALTAIYAAIILFTNAPVRRKRQVVILAIIETIEYSITNAARTYVVNFMFFIFFALLIFKRHSILAALRRNKKIVALTGVLLIAGLIFQNSRSSGTSIVQTLYMYYCSGPSYLSRLLEDKSVPIAIGNDYYYGTMTLGFLSNIFYYLKIAVTGINESTVKLLASIITIKQYHVGSHTYLNAMCTCFYPFLADWGIWGTVLGPLFSAFLGCHYYGRMKKEMDMGSVAICIYVFYTLFYTSFKWNFLYIDFSVILVLNYFLCPRIGQLFCLGKMKSNYNDRHLGLRLNNVPTKDS